LEYLVCKQGQHLLENRLDEDGFFPLNTNDAFKKLNISRRSQTRYCQILRRKGDLKTKDREGYRFKTYRVTNQGCEYFEINGLPRGVGQIVSVVGQIVSVVGQPVPEFIYSLREYIHNNTTIIINNSVPELNNHSSIDIHDAETATVGEAEPRQSTHFRWSVELFCCWRDNLNLKSHKVGSKQYSRAMSLLQGALMRHGKRHTRMAMVKYRQFVEDPAIRQFYSRSKSFNCSLNDFLKFTEYTKIHRPRILITKEIESWFELFITLETNEVLAIFMKEDRHPEISRLFKAYWSRYINNQNYEYTLREMNLFVEIAAIFYKRFYKPHRNAFGRMPLAETVGLIFKYMEVKERNYQNNSFQLVWMKNLPIYSRAWDHANEYALLPRGD